MTPNQICTSLELSKRLKELGVKQNGYFFWKNDYPNNPDKYEDKWYLIPDTEWPYAEKKVAVEFEDGIFLLSAFTASELGEMLTGEDGMRYFNLYPCKGGWACHDNDTSQTQVAPTLADAMALMLIWLIEHKIIDEMYKMEDKAVELIRAQLEKSRRDAQSS